MIANVRYSFEKCFGGTKSDPLATRTSPLVNQISDAVHSTLTSRPAISRQLDLSHQLSPSLCPWVHSTPRGRSLLRSPTSGLRASFATQLSANQFCPVRPDQRTRARGGPISHARHPTIFSTRGHRRPGACHFIKHFLSSHGGPSCASRSGVVVLFSNILVLNSSR